MMLYANTKEIMSTLYSRKPARLTRLDGPRNCHFGTRLHFHTDHVSLQVFNQRRRFA